MDPNIVPESTISACMGEIYEQFERCVLVRRQGLYNEHHKLFVVHFFVSIKFINDIENKYNKIDLNISALN